MNYSGRPPCNRVSPQLEAADVEVNRFRRLIAERDDALQHNLLLRDWFVAHSAEDVVFGSTAPNSRQVPERETTVTKFSSNEGTNSVVHGNIGGHYPVSRAGHRLRDWLPSCPYLDLSGPNADVKTWLREGRWPLKDGAVVEGKSRSVPRASNRHVVELSVGERATEMCAAVRHRMDTMAPSDEDDRYSPNVHPLRYRVSELCFG